VVHKPSNNHVRCPYRIVGQATGREIDWINQYLDYEMLRRLADTTLRTYAHELLHFLRWWEGVHHTDAVAKDLLTETTLLDYVRFQSGQERELTGGTINQRVAIVDRALRITFPDAPHQAAPALQTNYWQRAPMGIGKPPPALSRLRVKTPKRTIVPLSVDEVARFCSSFRNSRDLAIVGLMLLQEGRYAAKCASDRSARPLSPILWHPEFGAGWELKRLRQYSNDSALPLVDTQSPAD
jgi:integrase